MPNAPDQVTWRYLILLWGAAVAVSTGAIWLGAISNQVTINTKRLDKLELFADEVRQHDANTTAEQRAQDQRVDRLERMLNAKP